MAASWLAGTRIDLGAVGESLEVVHLPKDC